MKNTIPVLSLSSRKTWLLIAGAAFLWGIAVFLWLQKGMDKTFQVGHSSLRKIPLVTGGARALSTYGMAFCVLIYLICLGLSFKYDGLKDIQKIYLLILLSFAISGLAGDLSKEIFVRPRPFLDYPQNIVPITRPPSYSIPSGHTAKSFALVLPFLAFLQGRKWWRVALKAVLFAAALAVAYSRIVLGVHYLSDILAGAGTALLFLPLAAKITNAIYKRGRMTETHVGRLAGVCGLILLSLVFYLIHYS